MSSSPATSSSLRAPPLRRVGQWVSPAVRQALEAIGAGRGSIRRAADAACRPQRGSRHRYRVWQVARRVGAGSVGNSHRPRANHLTRYGTLSPHCSLSQPDKALGADQENSLSKLAALVDPHIGIATVDGDADSPQLGSTGADIVLTNPDFAHFGLLGRHEMWQRLWRGLQFIVVDEFHSYRGAFAANVALMVRRLMRVARHYGADPRIIFLSATATSLPFRPSASGPGLRAVKPSSRTVHLLGSATSHLACREIEGKEKVIADEGNIDVRRRAANTEAGELTATLVANDARVLTFVRSRPGTERVAEVCRSTSTRAHPTSKAA